MIAWLWARTVASPNPAARGAHVPLVSGFMLSTKPGKEAWVEPVIDLAARDGYRFDVHTGKADPQTLAEKKSGTKVGGSANFRCLMTDTIIQRAHIVSEDKGTAGRATHGNSCRRLSRARLPAAGDRARAHRRQSAANLAPDTDLPKGALGFRVQEYGIPKHRDMFTSRQFVALTTFSDLVLEHWLRQKIHMLRRLFQAWGMAQDVR